MDVRLPNGIIIRNVPEGTTREQVFEKAQAQGLITAEELPVNAAPVEGEVQPRGSFLDPIMQGLTLGASDELAGIGGRLGAALAGAPAERVEAAGQAELEASRARLADIRTRSPWLSLLNEVSGGMATGAPLARGLTGAFQAARMGPITAPIAAAATEGGLAGTMAADENRLAGGLLGATLGGGTAGAMPLIGGGLGILGRQIEPFTRKITESPPTTASRMLSETLTQAGETPERLMARAQRLGPEATMTDVAGPAGQFLGQGVVGADKTGRASVMARELMERRGAGSTDRLRRDIQNITGVKGRALESIGALASEQKAKAAPFYQAAYAQEIPLTNTLKNILNRPAARDAFESVKRAAANRGEDLPPWFKLDDFGQWEQQGVMPDMRAWDRMKKGIDRLINKQQDPVTGKFTDEGRDLIKLKNDLTNELDAINRPYAQARQLWSDDEGVIQAVRSGKKFLTTETEAAQEIIDGLTESERRGYLIGAMDAIREKMGRARSGEIGEFRFLEATNAREKLESLLGKEQAQAMMDTLKRERTFATTQGLLIGGSQTGPREAARQAMASGTAMPTTVEALMTPGRSLANLTLQGAGRELGDVSQRAISELAELMLDPNRVQDAIAEMQRRGIPQQQISDIMARYARGGAMVAPVLGLGAGEMVNQ